MVAVIRDPSPNTFAVTVVSDLRKSSSRGK